METFEIMFDDLKEEAQKQFLEFQGLDSPEDGNYEFWPIAVIELGD